MTAVTRMTHQPRLARAIQLATAFLHEHDVTSLPIDPAQLLKKCGWTLKRYTRIVERAPDISSLEELISLLKSPDAATICTGERIIILYNDTVTVPERIRFTLCHEIGHIILGHFTDFEIERLSQADRTALETEANVFAACLIAPVGVMLSLRHPYLDAYRHIFGMSQPSWKFRKATLSRDRSYLSSGDIKQEQEAFSDFMSARENSAAFRESEPLGFPVCPKCGTNIVYFTRPPNPSGAVHDCRFAVIAERLSSQNSPQYVPKPEATRETHAESTRSFPWSPNEWSQFTFACMAEADRAMKNRPKGPIPLGHPYLDENPMVIDELWEPCKRRRSQNRKRRTPSSHS